MNTDDLDRWLEALGGHDGDPGDAEGRALRAQIRSLPSDPVAPVAQRDAAREARLIARARAAGILPRRLPRPALLAAAVAGIALGVATLQYTRAPTETYRGVSAGVVELEARHPQDLKAQLLRELQQAGVHASGYARLDRVGIDADLPQPVTADVRRVLDKHHIPVPDDGALVVEIHAPGSR